MLATAWRTPSLISLVKRRKLSSSPPWKALKSSIENICFHLTSERERVRRFLKPRVIYIVLISRVIFSLTSASHRNMIPTLMSWEVEWARNHWLVDIGLRVNHVEIVHRKKEEKNSWLKCWMEKSCMEAIDFLSSHHHHFFLSGQQQSRT